MMEALARFPALGTIRDFMALDKGEKALYEQFSLIKLQEEAKFSGASLLKSVFSNRK